MKTLSLIVLLVFPLLSFANSSLPNGRHISVTGKAELQAKPDIAILNFDVESIKPTSIEAKADVDERVNTFLEGLSKYNVDENNISASNLVTEPNFSYYKGKEEQNGYLAERSLKVTLNNIKWLNDLMDFALKAGINSITNIRFTSSNAEKLKNEVNTLAVKNAKEKAKSLANAFEAKLSHIYSINSTSSNFRHRFGSNDDIEVIEVHGISSGDLGSPKKVIGKYLQENIVFSSSINVVFDIVVK